MGSYKIRFLPADKTILAEEGTTILEAEQNAGLKPDAPCGGRGICGKCNVTILQNKDRIVVRACQTRIQHDMVLETSDGLADKEKILTNGEYRTVPVLPAVKDADQGYLMAFDIGTTTIAGYLLSGKDGRQCSVVSMMNPQFQFGADVIARANYVLEHDGKRMQEVVQEALNKLIEEACRISKITPTDIRLVSIAGNTCMHHLFLGLSPKSLVTAPYVPEVKDGMIMNSSDLNIHIHPDGKIMLLPNIAGFVGADTSACMLAVNFKELVPRTLMIDIGTNGELVLGNKDRIVTCSTAAGPAFEGARIACGMRGTKGAVSHVYEKDLKMHMEMIDSKLAVGICGSGLIDIIAFLIQYGFIDSSGAFLKPEVLKTATAKNESWRLQKRENMSIFLLQEEDKIKGLKEIYITQKDIREVQLAKGAIAAGIKMLCKKLEIKIEQIDQVLLAGAFGNYMNTDSACVIGLIPYELKDKIRGIGNAAGEGAKLAAVNGNLFQEICDLVKRAEAIELAVEPEFQDLFIDELEFARALET